MGMATGESGTGISLTLVQHTIAFSTLGKTPPALKQQSVSSSQKKISPPSNSHATSLFLSSRQAALTLPETEPSHGTCLHSHIDHVVLDLSLGPVRPREDGKTRIKTKLASQNTCRAAS